MRKIIGIIYLCVIGLQVTWGQTVREAFLSYSGEELRALPTSSRMDLLDLYDADREALVLNSWGDTVRLTRFSEHLIKLENGNLNLQLVLLPLVNDSQVIAVVQTVCAPDCDSRIAFYSDSWKPLDNEAFIDSADLITFNPSSDDAHIWDIPFTQWHYEEFPEGDTLLQVVNMSSLYHLNGEKQLYKKEEIRAFRWTGTRFAVSDSQ